MASYNREFLVPYLLDVCALYMADITLRRELDKTMSRIDHLKRGVNVYPKAPEKPSYEEMSTGAFFSMAGGICLILIGFFADLSLSFIGGVVAFIGWALMMGTSGDNKKRKTDYDKEYAAYVVEWHRIDDLNNGPRKDIPGLQEKVKRLQAERKKLNQTLMEAYSANIIPSRYRDIYSATYLYDYFSTSRSTDMDMALNTYVLEQIKDRLDKIIENQHDIILNQRLMMANQQRSFEQQQKHNAIMKSKINQIAASSEEQSQYLAMVESNTRVTSYFAAANYLYK